MRRYTDFPNAGYAKKLFWLKKTKTLLISSFSVISTANKAYEAGTLQSLLQLKFSDAYS